MSPAQIYDVIFVGGGTAACITAGRLAATDSSLRILIIEDGPHTRDKPIHIQPARYYANLINPNSESLTFHVGRPSQPLGGRAPIIPTGHCVGGGSCVNFMMYTRASASDYDDWKIKYKNVGWGSKDLIPLLQKPFRAETFDREAPLHGLTGPLKIRYWNTGNNVGEDFLDVASKYDRKRPIIEDVNGFYECDAYSRWAQYVDPITGRRSDTAHYHIYNQIDHNPNLVLLTGRRVVRILFEGIRAVGVEYVNGHGSRTDVARAERLVVVAAGTLGSPSILERSGIGSVDILNKHGIDQFIDLPGVGQNYMDHNFVCQPYPLAESAETLDAIWRGDEDMQRPFVREWQETGQGMLAHNGITAAVKVRPHRGDMPEIGKEFQNLWKAYFEPAPDKPVIMMAPISGYMGPDPVAASKKFLSFAYFACYPASLGFVHIGSGTDPYAPIDFHPGFLDKHVDLGVLRWGYKKTREIARRMKLYRGEHASGHPKFRQGSAAECKSRDGPVDINSPDIVYSKEDDKAIDEYHRANVATTWHSLGTCAMKPREDGGVVDPRLNVYGTKGLKIADCSICPGNVGSNTYNTAIAIGEKAAILIAEDLGNKGYSESL